MGFFPARILEWVVTPSSRGPLALAGSFFIASTIWEAMHLCICVSMCIYVNKRTCKWANKTNLPLICRVGRAAGFKKQQISQSNRFHMCVYVYISCINRRGFQYSLMNFNTLWNPWRGNLMNVNINSHHRLQGRHLWGVLAGLGYSFPPVATGTCPSCPLAQVDMAALSPQPPCVHQLWVHYRFAWSQSFSSSKFTRSSLIWGTRVTAHSQAALIAPDETWVWFCWRPCIKRQHNRRALSNSSAA